MPSAAEIARALAGVRRLAGFQNDGLAAFDASEAGLWRSFFAMVIVAPAYVAAMAIDPHPGVDAGLGGLAMLVLLFGLSWLAGPVLAIPFALALRLGDRYVPFVVAWNWMGVLQWLAYAPTILVGAGVIGEGLGRILQLLAGLYMIALSWFVARAAFRTSGLAAAALIVAEHVVLVLLWRLLVGGIAG